MFKKDFPHAIVLSVLTAMFIFSPFALTSGAQAQASLKASSFKPKATSNYASLVDPLTGTGVQNGASYGGGDTFPGADVPFGMVQLSPDTANGASGGYDYYDNRIKGFSLTHLNGAGCDALDDLPIMPYVGSVTSSPASDPTHYLSTYSHSNETAYAGYYKVGLDNGVTTELSATLHSGAARFTYPAGQTATLLANVSGSATGVSNAEATISANTIYGSATSGNFCGAGDRYTIYFWASFSQPFASYGTWNNDTVTPNAQSVIGKSTVAPAVQQANQARPQLKTGHNMSAQTHQAARPDSTVSGPGSGVYATFDTNQGTTIQERVGISFVSVANAQANVEQENPSGDFNTVLAQATQTWNTALGEIQVGGGTTNQVSTFYTAMYHAYLQPNVFSDVNGQYIGFDNKIYTTPTGHAQYANYSGWDIYRSEAQLLAFLAPSQASDIAQSMVNDYTQGGLLPKWTLNNAETYVMVGDPADSILASIYAFGGTNFDTQTALAAMVKQATQDNNSRPGLNYLQNQGYLPSDGSYGCCNYYGSAATTLEYNTADFAIGAFAGALGDTANYQRFVNRAQDWQNLLNTTDKYLEPRRLDSSFPTSYNPNSGDNWVEGDGAQYNWMVPFNLAGLFAGLGGNSAVVSRLDTFFTQLNAGDSSPYAFLGNEPSLETPWEYNYAGAPYRTQDVIRRVENSLYTTGPAGLAGNDDLGEMSSWYVFAAMGMFPETPGTADVVLTSPLFPSITIVRPGGQTFQINAPGASATTYYIQSLKVNGTTSTQPWLPASFIANGGTLDYALSTTANTSWGASATDAPPSFGSVGSTNGTFTTGFEGGNPQPNWVSTVDTNPYPAGDLKNVGGICCGLAGPEAATRNETTHAGNTALMYSGLDKDTTTSYAYMELFNLSGQNVTVSANTTLSYWIYPQSTTANALASGNNSTCVALDLIFSDGSNLRDSGAVDQNGNRAHPFYQCNHLTLDSWNHVTINLAAVANGKTILRIDQGYDQPGNTGGYRGYIDDISIG